MKKTIFALMCVILLSPYCISAIKTGIVIESDDDTYYGCVNVNEGESIYDAIRNLDDTREDIIMTIDGELTRMYYLRSINDLSDKTEGNKYYGWIFFPTNSNNDNFEDAIGVGIGDYKITKEESIGIKYTYTVYNLDWTIEIPPEKPEFFTFDQLCDNLLVNVTKIYVDGDRLSDKNVRRGKIQDVFPESEIKFKIELENLYDSSTDLEISDISIEGTIEEINDGEDIDEEISEFDLSADKEVTKDLEFKIPLRVEAKDRLLKIVVEAEDDAGIKYEFEFTYDLEVEKEEHDLRILNAELNEDSYECGENAFLELLVLNVGDGEEDVELSIVNEDLELDINEKFELSDDVFEASSKYEKRFNIWLPDDVSKGIYAIIITANYGGEKEMKNLDLSISDCDASAAKEDVIDVQTGEISEDFEEGTEAELTKDGMTTVKEVVTRNLPLVLTIVLVVLVVVIVGLGAWFFIVKK